MSTEQNKATLRRWMEGWNTRDVNVMEALADENSTTDYILHDPSLPGGSLVGIAAAKQWVRDVLKNAPDVRITIEDLVAEGDKVASRFTVHGTDASTGKPVTTLVMAISRFVGDKVAEEWQLAVTAETQT